MEKNEKQYADELVMQYRKIVLKENQLKGSYKLSSCIDLAINDVTNTMKALNEQYIEIWGKSKDWKYTEHNTYYQTVLQILKERL